MTSIPALSSTPIPGPQPSSPASLTGAQTAAAKDALPGATPTVNAEASALNWLMAWLGEQDVEADATEVLPEDAPVPAPVPVQAKVQWLSLLPSVPVFEAPVTTEAEDGSELETVIVATPTPVAEEEEVSGPPATASEQEEMDERVYAADTDPLRVAPAALVQVARIDTQERIPVPVPEPADTPQPSHPDSMTAVNGKLSVTDPVPGQSLPELTQTVNGVTQRPVPKPEDKGEVIWSAEFTVKEKQPAETGVALPNSAVPSQPETATRPLRSTEADANPDANVRPAVAGVRARQPEDSPRQQMGSNDPEPNAEEPEPKQPSIEPARERMSGKNSQDSKRDASPANNEHNEPRFTENGSRATAFAAEFVGRATAPSRISEAASVESVTLEPAAPLKPAQIATLQVDVPVPIGSEDMTPMRLVVSQRGDQVNVRLRTFDSAAAPIEDTRMQPLLHSLAEKGFVAELKPGSRLDESMPLTVERTPEKQVVMAESSGSQNDAQAFQNANERQQQNQERQQQQQAFFLRKQMKNIQSEAFTLPDTAETSKGTFQKGASR